MIRPLPLLVVAEFPAASVAVADTEYVAGANAVVIAADHVVPVTVALTV